MKNVVATESLSVVKNVVSSVNVLTGLPAISIINNKSYLIQQVCLLRLSVQSVSLSNLIAFKSSCANWIVTEGKLIDVTLPLNNSRLTIIFVTPVGNIQSNRINHTFCEHNS